MNNYLLTIEYDGTNFCGWQRQPQKRSVQGELEKALSKICAREILLNGTSRTDAGVHALGQRASFSSDFSIPYERIPEVANSLLAKWTEARGGRIGSPIGDLRIKSIEKVKDSFHARFDAKGKKYRYIINLDKTADVFRRNYCYQVEENLDFEKMKEAAKYIVGTHDFKCFQASGGKVLDTTVRTVYDLNLENKNDDIILEIKGDGFLYNMVRIISGTLVDIGKGKISPQEVKKIIESKDRRLAGHTAPPQGLYLCEVYYDKEGELL